MTISICAIAAMDEGRVIGRQGQLPWSYPEDMRHFSELTKGHTVLMGRKTWESLPPKFRPLPKRKNIVISRAAAAELPPGVELWNDAGECLTAYKSGRAALQGERLWVIGGAQIYTATADLWDEVFITLIHKRFEGDTFFPPFEAHFDLIEDTRQGELSFRRYVRSTGSAR